MAEITASLVKELREKTGAGMMDCKKALNEVAGRSREGRRLAAHQGPVGRLQEGRPRRRRRPGGRRRQRHARAPSSRSMPRPTSSAATSSSRSSSAPSTKLALDNGGDLAKIAAAPFPGSGRDVQGELTNMIATIGENMSLRRAASLSVSDGVVVAYTHNAVAPDLGKIGVLVALESDRRQGASWRRSPSSSPCMWRPTNPQSLTVADLDQAAIERERGVLTEKAGQTGKAGRHHRQDGRGRPAQVPPGSRAARAGLRDRRQDQVVEGGRRCRQAGRRAGPASQASCASPWARASRRSRKISRPRWLRSSRSSMNRVGAGLGMPALAQETDLRRLNAAGSPLSPRPAEALGRGPDGRAGIWPRSRDGRHGRPGDQDRASRWACRSAW